MAILAIMKRVPVTDLKNRLSEFLRFVKRGESLEVLERGIPIARIEPVRIDMAEEVSPVHVLTVESSGLHQLEVERQRLRWSDIGQIDAHRLAIRCGV